MFYLKSSYIKSTNNTLTNHQWDTEYKILKTCCPCNVISIINKVHVIFKKYVRTFFYNTKSMIKEQAESFSSCRIMLILVLYKNQMAETLYRNN